MLVLGDQLHRYAGALAKADPTQSNVLMIESQALAKALPHHSHKLVLVFSAMRHFAASLREEGFTVHYERAESFAAGLQTYLAQHPGISLQLMEPNDLGYREEIQAVLEANGARLQCLPNDLWLSSQEDFRHWAKGRKSLRMEHFYRRERRRLGWLMEGDQPAGGSWNYDHDNRQVPDATHRFPKTLRFSPDAISLEVIAEVKHNFAERLGAAQLDDPETFAWPVTRQQALETLEHFCSERLRDFGPYEDAMRSDEAQLYHSNLSIPLNLGLLSPREVCETALAYAADGRRNIPLNSIEGFIRQILGWREFMFQLYRLRMPELAHANALAQHAPLPALYWNGDTKMHCLRCCWQQLQASGYNHHIQRLMIFGNFALLAGVNPQELTDWFSACYVDALEWVMVPNVMGMSQFADGGGFTSKPYCASANYIQRMSNYCDGCSYNPKASSDANACPFNSLYWHFIDRQSQRLANNPRMKLILANWRRRKDEDKRAILQRAEECLAMLAEGTL